MFGGLVRLELVYQLGAYGTKIERIALLQRHKNKVVWHIDLLDSGAAIQEVLPFAQPPAPEGSAAQRVLKPKRKSKKEEKDVSTG
jgi:Uri superfamily endonuclease